MNLFKHIDLTDGSKLRKIIELHLVFILVIAFTYLSEYIENELVVGFITIWLIGLVAFNMNKMFDASDFIENNKPINTKVIVRLELEEELYKKIMVDSKFSKIDEEIVDILNKQY